MPQKIKDLTNKRFGSLLVTELFEVTKRGAFWHYKCDCGKEGVRASGNLREGKTKSCGCERTQKLVKASTTHGGRNTPEYYIWRSIKNRCTNPKHKNFGRYGGRGIAICDSWLNDFSAFIADMGKRPTDKHTIDRIDNNLGYSKSNCAWRTHKEQANNKSSNRYLTYKGETLTCAQWADKLGITRSAINSRLKAGWPIARVVTQKGRNHG